MIARFNNYPYRQGWMMTAYGRTALLTLLVCAGWMTSLMHLPGVSTALHAGPPDLPVAFVPNVGQTASEVLFQVHDLNGTVFLTAQEFVLALADGQALRLVYQGSNADPRVDGGQRLPGTLNYLIGDDPAGWRTQLPVYGSIVYHDLYPGIDLRYEGQMGTVESIYSLAPGADPALIRWEHSGAQGVRIDADGRLLIYQAEGQAKPVLVEQPPRAWQDIAGRQAAVDIQYRQHADGSLGFALGAYDPAYGLTIDPTLVYSSYFGGDDMEAAGGVALDGDGNIYLSGSTSSVDFPTGDGAQPAYAGWGDVFVMKLNPAGDSLLYGTYLGGSEDDTASALAVDAAGNAYIAGDTGSEDFPTQNGYAAKCARSNGFCLGDAFLAKLSPDGDSLLYATYLGGANPDSAEGIAVDDDGQAYLSGTTFSSGFPTRGAYQASLKGPNDAFVARVDTALSGSDSLVFSTYLGGSGSDFGSAVALAGDQVVVVGETVSTDFPTHNPLQAANAGASDAFITSLDLDGARLAYSTYLGGSQQESAYAVATNGQGDAFVTGKTSSSNFPTHAAVQDSAGGGSDAFVTAIDAAGSAWLMSTYWGGSGAETGYALGVDSAGAVYLAGDTFSEDFPREDSLQAYQGGGDGFAVVLIPGSSGVVYSTPLGGSDSDYAAGVALDDQGHVFVSGVTYSTDFPTQDPLYGRYSGNGDVFLAKLNDRGTNPTTPRQPEGYHPLLGSYTAASRPSLHPGDVLTYTIYLHNSSTLPVIADVVDALPDGLTYSLAGGNSSAVFDASQHTLTWSGVNIPAGQAVELRFEVTAQAADSSVAVNTALITADGKSIERSCAVTLSTAAEALTDRPMVASFAIDSSDVLTSREVTLHTQLEEGSDAAWMYVREWQLSLDLFPHWEVVQSSGWMSFKEERSWTLGSHPGVHFITAWVADNDRKVSLWNGGSYDFASLLTPETELGQFGMVSYLVHYKAGEHVTAKLTPVKGDPDLYIWYPDNFILPDQVDARFDQAVEEISFTAPRDGVYIFLVHGFKASTYRLSITPEGANGQAQGLTGLEAAPESVTRAGGLFNEPLFSIIGLDPFGTQEPAVPQAPMLIFIPTVRR